MKFKLLLLSIMTVFSLSCSAQFFGPKERPYTPGGELKWRLSATPTPPTKNFVKPIISVSATFSNGASLAGGFGIAFQHTKADSASNTYVTQWQAALIAFLTVNASKIGGVGGFVVSIPGTAGMISPGIGYDFTNKGVVFITAATFGF
jgi:hypothetical protein